jgi:magnesium transporter
VTERESPASSSDRASANGQPECGLADGHDTPGAVRIVIRTAAGPRETSDPSELEAALLDEDARIWIDLRSPAPAVVAQVGGLLGLHPLVAEDIAERNQRAKLEMMDSTVHLVVFALGHEAPADLCEIDLVLGRRFLLSAHDQAWRPHEVPGLRRGIDAVLGDGVDFLLWVLLDAVVDDYFPVLDRLDDQVDRIQDDVVERADRSALQALSALKRELIDIRRVLAPTREAVAQLTNRQIDVIQPRHVVYFRDVYDHLIRATEDLDTVRDLAAGTLEVYLSQVNNDLSTIMKRLTGVTVILAGIAAITGIFGMSEAGAAVAGPGEHIGFWIVTGAIVLGAGVTALALRRLDWI